MRLVVMHERIHLPSGRVLWYPGLKNHARKVGHREDWQFGTKTSAGGGKVVENIAQAVARDVLWAQMVRIRHRLGDHARPVLRVHDEGVFLVREPEHGPWAKQVVEEEMAIPPDWLAGAPLAAEAAVATSWAECK